MDFSTTSGDETQMPDNYQLKISDTDQTQKSDSDNDETQMPENDEPPKNQHTSQIFHSRRKRIASDSHLNMDESSQEIGLDPDLADIVFRNPVRKAAKRRQISDVHDQQSYSDSDSHSEYKPENESDSPDSNSDFGNAADLAAGSHSGSPELGDNLSETQSSYPTQPTVKKSLNKPKARGSKSTEITESQRAKRVNFKNLKQQSLDEALGRAKQSQQEIDENRKKINLQVLLSKENLKKMHLGSGLIQKKRKIMKQCLQYVNFVNVILVKYVVAAHQIF